MGFSCRKSVSAGPFRFNLSGSGIGVSAGVRGFRVGTGPRGNYVRMGLGGISYHQRLPPSRESVSRASVRTLPPPETDVLPEIESGDVAAMTDSTAVSLLEELDRKSKSVALMPWVIVITVLLAPASGPAALFVVGVGGVLAWLARKRDVLARTTVILYDLDEAAQARYQQLHDAFALVAGCGRTAHISARGNTSDWKRNAGANSLVRRSNTKMHTQAPERVQTNVDVPALPVGRQTLHFFPDRLLVFDRGKVGAVAYADIGFDVHQSQFIETDTVPPDAQVVGQTWQYPNKKGGPDRRFSNNRQIPIALYEQLHFKSASGLNELIQVSKVGVLQPFVSAIRGLAGATEHRSWGDGWKAPTEWVERRSTGARFR